MPHAASTEPLASAADFAGLMASLAALKEPASRDEHLPLADDVTTLTYEGALRSHRRPQNPAPSPQGAMAAKPSAAAVSDLPGRQSPGVAQPVTATAPHERKCASITVRMSPEECSQLRERAAEAGITVSAYLRSCAFEVDSLRAQVKQTLAELRESRAGAVDHATTPRVHAVRFPRRTARFAWLRKLFLRRPVLREDSRP